MTTESNKIADMILESVEEATGIERHVFTGPSMARDCIDAREIAGFIMKRHTTALNTTIYKTIGLTASIPRDFFHRPIDMAMIYPDYKEKMDRAENIFIAKALNANLGGINQAMTVQDLDDLIFKVEQYAFRLKEYRSSLIHANANKYLPEINDTDETETNA
jgi:hypothetical protein